jgi:hypothetical protein
MAKTLAIHFAVVTARSRQALFELTFSALQVLHCDNHLGFVTIRPHRSRLLFLALVGSDDNVLSCGKAAPHCRRGVGRAYDDGSAEERRCTRRAGVVGARFVLPARRLLKSDCGLALAELGGYVDQAEGCLFAGP